MPHPRPSYIHAACCYVTAVSLIIACRAATAVAGDETDGTDVCWSGTATSTSYTQALDGVCPAGSSPPSFYPQFHVWQCADSHTANGQRVYVPAANPQNTIEADTECPSGWTPFYATSCNRGMLYLGCET